MPATNSDFPSPRRRGATVASWRAATPRALLEQVVARETKAKRDKILAVFRDELLDQPKLLDSVIEYWFTNNYNALIRAQEAAKPEAAKVAALRREETEKQVREAVGKAIDTKAGVKARIMLLDLMMPNGKRLRACTGEECLKLSKVTPRWLSLVTNNMGPKQKVGETFSEDQLHAFWQKANW